jgi:hypothetical protein
MKTPLQKNDADHIDFICVETYSGPVATFGSQGSVNTCLPAGREQLN